MKFVGMILFSLLMTSCIHKEKSSSRRPNSDNVEQIETAKFISTAGELMAHVSWAVDPIPPNNDVLRAFVEFAPKKNQKNLCPSIRFIQIARVEKEPDVDYDWNSFEKNRNQLRTEAKLDVVPGYFVDHLSDQCKEGSPCSPYFRDHWANANESQDGYKKSAKDLKKASLIDYPFGWTEFERISGEACAFCESSKQYYGCVKWSARWPLTGPREISKVKFQESPSRTFAQALEKFAAFYSVKKP